jgi:hypothetical protein
MTATSCIATRFKVTPAWSQLGLLPAGEGPWSTAEVLLESFSRMQSRHFTVTAQISFLSRKAYNDRREATPAITEISITRRSRK